MKKWNKLTWSNIWYFVFRKQFPPAPSTTPVLPAWQRTQPAISGNESHFKCCHSLCHNSWLVGWLCFTSHQQRGHLETAPPFTVPCEGHEARFLPRSHLESNLGSSFGSPLHYRCSTPAPHILWTKIPQQNLYSERVGEILKHQYMTEQWTYQG